MRRSSLPDVDFVNVNHKASFQTAVSRNFLQLFKKKYLRNLFLSLFTFGVYPYKRYKKIKHEVAQALTARKLFHFRVLQDQIEKIREDQVQLDPRQSLNNIYMRIQSKKISEDENALEFKAIFSPNEILLSITNPVRDSKKFKFPRLKNRRLDYLKIWQGIKKQARTNQYRQIQSINFCNKTLKQEYKLTSEGIHDRLKRTSIYRKRSCSLTYFKELSKAFQEVVLAYQDFEELAETNTELFRFIETLSKTSEKEIETLQTYLTSHYLPKDLPFENRRQLIQLGNQQDVLSHITEEEQLSICSLVLNHYQWDFLLSLEEVSQITLNLLDWAFEESSRAMKKPLSYLERLHARSKKRVKDQIERFPSLNEKIKEDATLKQMTVDFAQEINREWPSLLLFEGDKNVYSLKNSDSLTQESLIECYEKFLKFSEGDDDLFVTLQQAVSQIGKTGFQDAIEEGVMQLLGEKSQYFLPILCNTDVTIRRKRATHIQICYTFEQVILKKGEVQHPSQKEKYMIITQPLEKEKSHWVSLEPEMKIALKERVS